MSSAADGNNQESTSEAMQSWAGLFLLGSALSDQAMAAAGAMGYAIEGSATREYWFDYHGWKDGAEAAVHPPAYKARHTMASVVRDRDFGFWTWFSGRPAHVYGIQFIPTWHWMTYLGRDPAFMDWQIESMARRELKSDEIDWLALGDDWGVLAGIGAMSFGNPRRVTAIFDDAAAERAKLHGPGSLIQYWVAHTQQAVGAPAEDVWTDLPTSAAYRQPDGSIVIAAWNPGAGEAPVAVRRAGRQVGAVRVGPGELVVLRDLPFLRP
jgi:endoglucanase Acf2